MPKSKGREKALFLGRYEVLKELPSGKEAKVYLAHEKEAPFREVALKAVPVENWESPSAQFLKKEFAILKKLSHPHVVQVFDFGIDPKAKTAFAAEEYLEGKPSPHSQVEEMTLVAWVGQLAKALHYLHRHHLYHGDIKPENIMILKQGGVKLIDFGFAREAMKAGPSPEGLTGTLSYLAPERLGGAPPSTASDLYALGVAMYEWATGRLPFESKDSNKLIPAILSEIPPSPSKFNPQLSQPLSDLILSLLQKNPVDRPRQANDLLRELNARLFLNLPLEKERQSEFWWHAAGTVGKGKLIREILKLSDLKKKKKKKWVLLDGERGLGKSALLSVLASQLQLKGFSPQRCDVKALPPGSGLKKIFPGGLPSALLIDDAHLLPPTLRRELVKKAALSSKGIWIWSVSAGKDWKKNSFPGAGLRRLKPLTPLQEKGLLSQCLGLEKIDAEFASKLRPFTQGKPESILKALSVLFEHAIDPAGPLGPQLATLPVGDYLNIDPLAGVSARKKNSLRESRASLIEQTRQKLSEDPEDASARQLLVSLLTENGDYQEVLKFLDFEQDPLTYVNALNRVGRFQETLDLCRKLGEGEETPEAKISRLNQEGMAFYFLGRNENSAKAFEEAVGLCREKESWERLAVSLNNLANVVSHGDSPQKAVGIYLESLKTARKAQDPFNEGRVFANLGHVYHIVEDYAHALEYYYAGLNQYRKIGFLGEIIQIKSNLGGLYMELGAFPQAEEAILESIHLGLERDVSYFVFYAYNLYGDLLRRRRDFARAKEFYDKAREGFHRLHAKEDLKHVTLGLAQLAFSQKMPEACEEMLKGILPEELSMSMRAQWHTLMGQVFLSRGKTLEEIETHFSSALGIYQHLQKSDEQLVLHFLFYKLYTRWSLTPKAGQARAKVEALAAGARTRVPTEYWEYYQSLIPRV